MKLIKNNKISWIIIAILIIANAIAWFVVWDISKPKPLEVVFFDVGQGDSAFIESPNGNQVLIDGGPDSSVLERLEKEMPFYDRTIDLIILTHPDHDHLNGLIEVLKMYEVENIMWTGIEKDVSEYYEWVRLIEEEDANIIIAKYGQRVILQKDLFIDIVYPFDSLPKDINDSSVVSLLTFKNNSFLFTGDISKKVEKDILEDVDVLKVAHHGSNTSTSNEFLEKCSPYLAIISVGDNSYGHPALDVLARLESFGIDVLRTDELKDIKVISDGDNLKVKTNIYERY